MSKILIVPDVHGRSFWHTAEKLINEVDEIIFLGDYLDPYWGVTGTEALDEFKQIIEFKLKHYNKVTLLLGNHDCAYCFNFGSASRYDYKNESEIKKLFNKYKSLFDLFSVNGNYLFTHAGITNEWLSTNFPNCDINEFLTLSNEEIIPYLWEISYIRGGINNSGSLIWSDIRELDREDTYYQIFGHTQLASSPEINDKFACLDVRKCFILDTETNEINPINAETC